MNLISRSARLAMAALLCCAVAANAAPGSSSSEKAVKLRLSSNVSKKELDGNKTAMAKGLNAWIATVQKASNGSITIELFTDAQLASSTEQIVSGIKSGGFEVAHFATGNWAEYTNAFAELNVPYLFSSYDEVHAVLDSDIGKSMKAQLEKDVPGIKALAYIDIGFRHVTNSRKVIKSPADMKGLKIRTMSDKLQMAAMQALGASVTPLPIAELYSALQQRLVDAQENPLSTIYSNKFYEVNKYCTLSRHSYTSTFMFMARGVYDGLSEAQKKAVDAANEACTRESRAAADSAEKEYQGLLEAAGMGVYAPTKEEMQKFREAASKSWSTAEKLMGADRYKRLLAVVDSAS